ncbi:methylmalonate-semialdehyde dehydrogenase [Plectosphaerella cucumerina]|uniref:methylmalonate-semialdehyde dehydrogenase (CoA acylating) n=1 Tax=Plectosphaerella cucumerina TaxID=40658 RepID=A0A8K0X470_9PEZI|nr:methylmalonate-semialdehyde dehydrogenase [Plectosphaerella cucumerina]
MAMSMSQDSWFVFDSEQEQPVKKRPRPSVSTGSDVSQQHHHAGPPLQQDVIFNFIGNEFCRSSSRTWMKIFDPVDQKFITRVPDSNMAEVTNAVAAADAALSSWATLPPSKRRKLILNLLVVLPQYADRITKCLCAEGGKTIRDAQAEYERGVDSIEAACAASHQMVGDHHISQMSEIHTTLEPVGVCVSITPFNFPFMIPLWSIPFALLSGNTVVLKPSEKTPSAAQILAECFWAAGFPPGVVNIVHGGPSVVEKLLAQPSVGAVSFVGSDIAGERVHDHARATRKRVQAECSAKNHGVVLADADKKKTLYAIAGGAFGSAGQRCMALSVVVLVGEARSWADDIAQLAMTLIVGDGKQSGVDMGPLITKAAKARVEEAITAAESEGATVLLDGRNYLVPDYPDGNFVGPTILTNVQSYMTCYQEEIFGPVLCCMEVETMEEAIQLINSNRYGNGCTLFTSSPTQAQLFQKAVNVGQVGINVPVLATSGTVLRTGNKESFLGDHNVSGHGMWQFYTMTKTITTIWH